MEVIVPFDLQFEGLVRAVDWVQHPQHLLDVDRVGDVGRLPQSIPLLMTRMAHLSLHPPHLGLPRYDGEHQLILPQLFSRRIWRLRVELGLGFVEREGVLQLDVGGGAEEFFVCLFLFALFDFGDETFVFPFEEVVVVFFRGRGIVDSQ